MLPFYCPRCDHPMMTIPGILGIRFVHYTPGIYGIKEVYVRCAIIEGINYDKK